MKSNGMRLEFSGKHAVVTGASRGIGEAIARTLLELGGAVTITSTGRRPDWLSNYADADHIQLDFQDPVSIRAFFVELERGSPIDILINNAGIHQPEPVDQITTEAWDRIFEVNLRGPMQTTRYVSAQMKRRRSGRIVNIASIAGTVCKENAAAYSTSKLGLIGFTRSSALDLAPFGILVNSVSPGTTQTEMVERVLTEEQRKRFLAGIPLGRFANPQEIATCAVFLASDLNSYMTGQNIIVDGGTVII